MERTDIMAWGARGLAVLAAALAGGAPLAISTALLVVNGALKKDYRSAEEAIDGINEALGDSDKSSDLRKAVDAHRWELEQAVAATSAMRDVNATMRLELQSEDWFVRRARPAIIWSMALQGFCFVALFIAALLFSPEWVAPVGQGLGSAWPLFAVQAGVAGVYIAKRTRDKEIAAGLKTPGTGFLRAVAKALS